MADELSPQEIATLKSRFRAAGCAVTALDDSAFEIVSDDFPVRTHVYATPYYLQLATNILAKPRQGVPIEKVREFLCAINLKASLVKFTMETDRPDEQTEAWPILASVKLVTGVVGGDYQASAIKNLFLLWLQDIAELMAEPPDGFEIHPMMDIERLSDA
jgi:hypothetical protein